jgi:hypothetical protein
MIEYQNGILLAEAAWEFAPRSLIREYKQARTSLANCAKPFEAQAYASTGQAFLHFMDTIRAPIDVRALMQETLLTGLREGKFMALGYRLPRDLSDPAVQIPADLFESRYVTWHNSTIKGAGLEFVNVRVVRTPKNVAAIEHRLISPILNSRPGNSVAYPENRRKPGRPSKTPIIEEAYNGLDAIGAVQASATKQAIAADIQKWIERHHPGKPAPGYEAIRRYIVKRQCSKL